MVPFQTQEQAVVLLVTLAVIVLVELKLLVLRVLTNLLLVKLVVLHVQLVHIVLKVQLFSPRVQELLTRTLLLVSVQLALLVHRVMEVFKPFVLQVVTNL